MWSTAFLTCSFISACCTPSSSPSHSSWSHCHHQTIRSTTRKRESSTISKISSKFSRNSSKASLLHFVKNTIFFLTFIFQIGNSDPPWVLLPDLDPFGLHNTDLQSLDLLQGFCAHFHQLWRLHHDLHRDGVRSNSMHRKVGAGRNKEYPGSTVIISESRWATSSLTQYLVFFRFFYGFALDRIPYRIVLCFQTGLMAVLVGTLYWTSTLGKEVFTIWMYLLYATFPGIFSILPGI